MFKKILIANRGEIAVRIIRACRELSITTVAVYSEVDENALHVIDADEAYCIGKPEPADSYLNMSKIIQVAQENDVDAIHPGYGFLAENPKFALECRNSNICFIGPDPEAMALLGDKIKSRSVMQEAGIPLIPGMVQELETEYDIQHYAKSIGYPVILKASAGGGGKGMRVVGSQSELSDAIESGKREAQAAFGNDAIYVEKYIENSRHIEFQVLADHHGQAIHLNERECSIQRRHQKIVEESPSPNMTDNLRQRMGNVALEVVKKSGYTNAGTVEFLLDTDDSFYFLEVNARLQVEHPITELVSGIDLVKQQIRIAAGEKLEIQQTDVHQHGHAIECRIYAEDPNNDFMPSFGTIEFLQEPVGPWIRIDTGVREGMNVPIDYDPILSKVITWGTDREEARIRMHTVLKEYILLGVQTQIPFLIDLIDHNQFIQGNVDTNFINQNMADWASHNEHTEMAALVAALHRIVEMDNYSDSSSVKISSPWTELGGWKI